MMILHPVICFVENKNRVVFWYICDLIQRGVFKDVIVSFLPVGHTHNHVDGLAGTIKKTLKNIDLLSISE